VEVSKLLERLNGTIIWSILVSIRRTAGMKPIPLKNMGRHFYFGRGTDIWVKKHFNEIAPTINI